MSKRLIGEMEIIWYNTSNPSMIKSRPALIVFALLFLFTAAQAQKGPLGPFGRDRGTPGGPLSGPSVEGKNFTDKKQAKNDLEREVWDVIADAVKDPSCKVKLELVTISEAPEGSKIGTTDFPYGTYIHFVGCGWESFIPVNVGTDGEKTINEALENLQKLLLQEYSLEKVQKIRIEVSKIVDLLDAPINKAIYRYQNDVKVKDLLPPIKPWEPPKPAPKGGPAGGPVRSLRVKIKIIVYPKGIFPSFPKGWKLRDDGGYELESRFRVEAGEIKPQSKLFSVPLRNEYVVAFVAPAKDIMQLDRLPLFTVSGEGSVTVAATLTTEDTTGPRVVARGKTSASITKPGRAITAALSRLNLERFGEQVLTLSVATQASAGRVQVSLPLLPD